MKLLKGKKISEKILKDLGRKMGKEKIRPNLAVILVGDDKASEIYVRLKEKAAKMIGIGFKLFRFKKNEGEKIILKKLSDLNGDKNITGIIVQLPLPKKFTTQKIINYINPQKDVDGFHPKNSQAFLSGKEGFWPVFPRAIIKLLEAAPRRRLLESRKAAVLVNSKKFGEVMVAALARKQIRGEYILYMEIKKNLKALKKADIIISACGHPGFIKGKMVKKGVIVIDGGITKRGERVLGDVDRQSLEEITGCLSPVPGGVGPVTIACLLENVYIASKKQSR